MDMFRQRVAFSTGAELRIRQIGKGEERNRAVKLLTNEGMSPLFLAVIEATEEAIDNSLFQATTITGQGRTVEALPLDRTREILRKHDLLGPTRSRR
jgi:D-aminopeptidase